MVSYESIVLRIIGVDELSDPLGKGKKGFDDLGDSADKSSKKASKGLQDVGDKATDAGGKIDQTTGKLELMGAKGALALAGIGTALLGLSALFIQEAMAMEHQWDAFASALGMTNLEFKEVKEEYNKDLDEMSQQTLRTKGALRDNMVPLMAIGGTYEDSLAAQKYISGMAALRGTSGNDKADFQKAEGEYEMMIRGRNPQLTLKKYGMDWKDLGVEDKKGWEALTVPERMERVNKALSENNQIMKANENRMDSTTAKYDYLIGRTKGLMGVLGEDMLPMVNTLLEGLIWLVEGFINQPEWVHQIVGWGVLLGGFLAIAIAGIALLNVGLKQTLDAIGGGGKVWGRLANWFDDKRGKEKRPDGTGDSPIDKVKKDVDGKKVGKGKIDLDIDCTSVRKTIQKCLDKGKFKIEVDCEGSGDDSDSDSSSSKKKKKKKKKGKAGILADEVGDALGLTDFIIGGLTAYELLSFLGLDGALAGIFEGLTGFELLSFLGLGGASTGTAAGTGGATYLGVDIAAASGTAAGAGGSMLGLAGGIGGGLAAGGMAMLHWADKIATPMFGWMKPGMSDEEKKWREAKVKREVVEPFDASFKKLFTDPIGFFKGLKLPDKNSIGYKSFEGIWKSVTGAVSGAVGSVDGSLKKLYDSIAGWVGSSTDELKKLWCSVVGCSPGIIPAFKKMANEVPGHIDKVHPHIQKLNTSLQKTKGINLGTSSEGKHVHQHGSVTIDARHMNAEQLKGLMTEVFEGTINSRAAPKVDTSTKGTPMSKTAQVTP